MVNAELIGIQSFQQVAILVGQTGETTGNVAGLGIMNNGIQSFSYIPTADREQIDTALVELGEEHQILTYKGSSLAAPLIEVGKVIFTAPLAAIHQILVKLRLPFRNQSLK